jgi:hypothetical protein
MHQTRRIFLKGGLVAGGGLLLSALGTTMEVSASERGDTAQTILNLAATAEAFATTHIHTVLTGRDFALSNFEIQQLKLILDAEQQHLDLIVANGGVPAATQFFTPAGTYQSRLRFATVTADVETVCTALYLAATRRFADLGNARLAATQAQLAANEAQHIGAARQLAGQVPSDIAWAPPLFFNPSDVEPVFAPFLNGGPDFNGPVAYPGIEQVRNTVGDLRARTFPTFTTTF